MKSVRPFGWLGCPMPLRPQVSTSRYCWVLRWRGGAAGTFPATCLGGVGVIDLCALCRSANVGGASGVDGGHGAADSGVRKAQPWLRGVAVHPLTDAAGASSLGPLDRFSAQRSCHGGLYPHGPWPGEMVGGALADAARLIGTTLGGSPRSWHGPCHCRCCISAQFPSMPWWPTCWRLRCWPR